MPMTLSEVFGTCADGAKSEDYCTYCYRNGKFTQECTMDEMIEHCAAFVEDFNKDSGQTVTREEAIGQMKAYFPRLKRWRQSITIPEDGAESPADASLISVKALVEELADNLPTVFISSVDDEGFPWTKAMLGPREREGIKVFYLTTNTFSLRVAHYKSNPKASIYFCDEQGFRALMLRGTMEVLTDADTKRRIWRDGDTEYYPLGVDDPNYCVLKFTASDGRFYSDYQPRTFIL